MSKRKFKIGDKVIIYGVVKGTIVAVDPFGEYTINYEKHIPGMPDSGYFKSRTLELIEIFESPLYKAMSEEHDD